MTADTFLLSDTHHDESTACQVKSILLHFIAAKRTPIADVLIPGVFGHSTRTARAEELEQAAIAHREVLDKQVRELVPLDWAATQNNIGAVLSALGEQEFGTERLEQAVTAYRNALKEYTREHTPFNWAHTQINLANALQLLGARKKDAGLLEQAVMAYDGALAVLGSTSNEDYTSRSRANRDRARAQIAELKSRARAVLR